MGLLLPTHRWQVQRTSGGTWQEGFAQPIASGLSLSLISFNGLGYGSSKISKVCSLGLSLSHASGYLTYIKYEKNLFFPAQGAVPRCLSIPVEEASEFLQQDLKNKINCTVAKVCLHQLLDLLPDRQTLTFVNLLLLFIVVIIITQYYHYSLSSSLLSYVIMMIPLGAEAYSTCRLSNVFSRSTRHPASSRKRTACPGARVKGLSSLRR